MSQRTAAAASSQRQDDVQAQTHSPDNHLMPASLRHVPGWFQLSPFQYNMRFIIAFLPGALLVATVTGKMMVGAAILGVVVALLLRSSEQKYLAMYVSIAHVFGLAVLNVYCLAPLIWQSVLNIPLLVLFHAFIALSGIWWWLQDTEFMKQDPRFLILIEKILFSLYPGVCVTMVTWVCAMLFGRSALPYAVALAGLVALSLFMSPLPSSFAKPNTPTNTGLIQHWSVALVYLTLELSVPALLHFALFHTASVHSWMVLSLLVLAPVFLMTLLESQGLLSWLRLGSKSVQFLRWGAGAAVMLLLSLMVVWSRPSSLLPLLLLPVSYTSLGLLSSLEHSSSSSSSSTHHSLTSYTLTLAAATALLTSAAFLFLPWSITHSFSFLSLPLSVVQLLVWCITITTIAMVTFHKRLTSSVWLPFNTVFLLCEYILSWEGVYPSYLALTTACAGALLFWRLHGVGKLSLNSCLLVSSLHLTKLSLLLPPSPSHSSPLSTAVAIFLLAYLILRLFVFQSQPFSLSPGQLLVFCGLLCCGLLLGVDSLLSPLWLSFTHRSPTSATLIATIIATTALFMNHGLSFVRSSEAGKLTSWPPSLILMSVLLYLLQPPFDPQQLAEAGEVVRAGPEGAGDLSPMPMEVLMAAWLQLLSWTVLGAATLVLVVTATYTPLTSAAATLLGASLGAMATIMLLSSVPGSLAGLLYILIGGLTGCLLGRAYTTPTTRMGRSFVDNILYGLLLLVMLAAFVSEYLTTPHMYMPRMHWFELFSVPCSRLGMGVFASIALACRIKMYQCTERPYLPVAANVSCLLFFLLSLLNPLHMEYEVSVVLSSLIFLLAQPDGRLLPSTSSLFLAPSLLSSVLVLYLLAGSQSIPRTLATFSKGPSLFLASRCLELLCLAGSIPGQAIFLYYLWTGRQLRLSIPLLVLYILPNAFLPQFGGGPSSTILGIVGVLSFCLIMLGDFTNLKLL